MFKIFKINASRLASSFFPECFLIFLWVLVQSYFFFFFGVKTSIDSSVYINDAHTLMSGEFLEGRSIWYSGYSVFLAFVFLLGGGIREVVLIQILLSGIAAGCLYRVMLTVTTNRWKAWLAVLLYLIWIKIHQWNVFIYTESFFTSLCIISFSFVVGKKKPWFLLTLIPLIIFTSLIRPTGFVFFTGMTAYLLSSLFPQYRLRKPVVAVIILLLISTCFVLLNHLLDHYADSFIDSYSKAEIIYPGINFGISTPDELYIPKDQNNPLWKLILFCLKNPLYFLKLSLIKLAFFFGNVKPYFSITHNLFIVLVLYPLYYFAIRGFLVFPKSREKYFILYFIMGNALIVAFTSENWDGRFLIPVLPFIFIFSAIGILSKTNIQILTRLLFTFKDQKNFI